MNITTIQEIVRSLRMKFLKARLRARSRIFENIPFEDIEKKYIGRAANEQLDGWRTVSSERGSTYAYYQSVDGQVSKRLGAELSRKVFLGNRAFIYSNTGIVYNAYYNCIVMDTLETWGADVNFSTGYLKITKKPTTRLKGLCISLMSYGAVNNYAHFLFDTITKLPLYWSVAGTFDHVLASGPEQRWKAKILKHLNLLDKVVWVNEGEEIECEQLLFTNRINYSRHCSPFALETIRSMFLFPEPTKPETRQRMIFASRKQATDRRSKLEEILHRLLPDSIEIVDFQELSMEETIRTCRECALFAGIHGAAFANLAFCNPGTRVIEIQPEDLLPEGHRHYYTLLCERLSFDHQVLVMSENISEDEVKALMATVLPLVR